ncbi:LON peptidase substrate-binding domain-containing protein [Emcibacter nanhaiensis]|uniref:Peptidase S16 n=1 Tax=Emcibacter nanhaiensis TaxID=1505037 RepID=A0A501PGP7_9PROT|nr:LON peptidase substrate-binding domain-containing protein [Emcibacter nanhaiensis]TPD59161.1 peptidase S16 [Emcibacter nanhaiensis]
MFGLEELPDVIPVFPLTRALLLPKSQLYLNIFEPRYLEMVEHAREGQGVIGMIQPLPMEGVGPAGLALDNIGRGPETPPLYGSGCLGMISSFEQTKDGQVTLMLTGLSRFDVVEELPQRHLYRELRVSYDNYTEDCGAPPRSPDIDRYRLEGLLLKSLEARGLSADWGDFFEQAEDEVLINELAKYCVTSSGEAQAVLEARSLKDRFDLMVNLLEINLADPSGSADKHYH